jgi:hypothetical protein
MDFFDKALDGLSSKAVEGVFQAAAKAVEFEGEFPKASRPTPSKYNVLPSGVQQHSFDAPKCSQPRSMQLWHGYVTLLKPFLGCRSNWSRGGCGGLLGGL